MVDDWQREADERLGKTAPPDSSPPWLVRFRREHGRQLDAGQFRLSHIVWLTIAVAILSTLGSQLGFEFLYGLLLLLFVLAPTTAVIVACLWPTASTSGRWVVGWATFALLVVAACAAMVYEFRNANDLFEMLAGLFVCGAVGWSLQGLIIWRASSASGFGKSRRILEEYGLEEHPDESPRSLDDLEEPRTAL